jgi:hypothetical protein
LLKTKKEKGEITWQRKVDSKKARNWRKPNFRNGAGRSLAAW